MIDPLEAEYFLPDLIESAEVRAACAAELGVASSDILGSAATGDAKEFLAWFERWRLTQSDQAILTIEAETPDYEVFEIRIGRAGPIYWVVDSSIKDDCTSACYYRTLAEAEKETREYYAFDIQRRHMTQARLGRALLRELLKDNDKEGHEPKQG